MKIDFVASLNSEEQEQYWEIHDRWVDYEQELCNLEWNEAELRRYLDVKTIHMSNEITYEDEQFILKMKYRFKDLMKHLVIERDWIPHTLKTALSPKLVRWIMRKDDVHFLQNPIPFHGDLLFFKTRNRHEEFLIVSNLRYRSSDTYRFLEEECGWSRIVLNLRKSDSEEASAWCKENSVGFFYDESKSNLDGGNYTHIFLFECEEDSVALKVIWA